MITKQESRIINRKSKIEFPGDSEPETSGAVILVEVIAKCRSDVPGHTEPGTATQNSFITITVGSGRSVGRCARVSIVPAIQNPFKRIPHHVENTEFVRFETTHRGGVDIVVPTSMHTPARVLFFRRLVRNIRIFTGFSRRITPRSMCNRPGTGDILPFRRGE